MTPIINAAPMALLRGVQDLSGRTPVYEAEALPQHLPHLFGFTRRGPLVPQLVIGDGLNKLYGAISFNLTSKNPYLTHQTLFANIFSDNANQMMFQRVVPNDSARSRFRLSLHVLPDTTGIYTRAQDGSIQYDNQGAPVLTPNTEIDIVRLVWKVTPIANDNTGNTTFGLGTVTQSVDWHNATNQFAQIVPIMDFEVSDPGKWGDGAGIRFSAPNSESSIPFDTRMITEQLTTMFRMQVVERESDISTPNIVETRSGDQFIDFSFKPGAFNEHVSQELYLPIIYKANYINTQDTPALYGTFSDVHIYEANVGQLLAQLYTAERTALASPDVGWTSTQIDDFVPVNGQYTINFFTAVGWNAYPYEAIRMGTATDITTVGGTEMKSSVTQYATGGSDGTITAAAFDALVANQCQNYGDLIVKRNPGGAPTPQDVPLDFMDTAKWPQSSIWDSGFSMATKPKLLVPMGRRKDIWVALSTQEIGPGIPQNTASQDSSVAATLQAAARMYPESEYFGTKACRAIVVGHSGILANSDWKGLAPMTADLAAKVATYFGASNGQWVSGKNFDISPANQVTAFKADTVNSTWKTSNIRNTDWTNGLIWVQSYDRRSLFYPGIQTVYDDDTSVLNTLFSIITVCELEKVCERVWRDLTGIQSLTVDQFIERSDKLIVEKTTGRFDGKMIIQPKTYLTAGDEQRGFSWSCVITFFAPSMKTVGTYTIVSRRIEDYQQ